MKIEKELRGIKKNVLLKSYTTFKIGGLAKYFFIAKTKEDLIKAIQIAKKFNYSFFILGGGSNLLISDKGFNGLVIKYGQPLSLYVSRGLEWAAGIPGTIQGAVAGNAGAFGKSMKDAVKEVEVFDVRDKKIKIFQNKDCKFGQKNSVFKKDKNLIILSVVVKLKKSDYKKIKEYLDYRKKNHQLSFPSIGCVFKNYQGKIKNQKLLEKFPELKEFNKKQIIPVGWLVEKSGLKGKKINKIKIFEKHCNFIVNLGNGKAKDVMFLIKMIKQKVKHKFKIILEEEIQFLGF